MKDRAKHPFTLAGSKGPVIADRDNTAPRPKPPAHVPQPSLAPPGMMGVRPRLLPPTPPKLTERPARLGERQGQAQQAFKSLVGGPPGQRIERDR